MQEIKRIGKHGIITCKNSNGKIKRKFKKILKLESFFSEDRFVGGGQIPLKKSTIKIRRRNEKKKLMQKRNKKIIRICFNKSKG